MIRLAFITITDARFFPGTLASVNSILEFHPDADIYVISNHKEPLTGPQSECLQKAAKVQVIDSRTLDAPERHIESLELKAYACHDLSPGYDVVVGIDSDCLLCSNVSDVVQQCGDSGGFLGGRDGDGISYNESYGVYGFSVPARNPRYMSTSIYFCAVNPKNRDVLARWVDCCNQARFNEKGPYPGHVDQGVLNAVLFAMKRTSDIGLLDDRLWSQHHSYWDSVIHFREGQFRNISALGRQQRAFHSGGPLKFWLKEHRDYALDGHELQMYPYIWFLAMLWFGLCGNWTADPRQYLPPASRHLYDDLIQFLPQILQVYPPARQRWNDLSTPMINRALTGIPRALPLGSSMSEVIELVAAHPGVRRYVEIGGYEGGSILTLGLRFLNRDIDFFCVESFMGNLTGTMDGSPLPSRRRFAENLARFSSLRVNLIPGDSALAAGLFEDASVECVFIDACHETRAVLTDIDVWLPKLRCGGIIAGDDYLWGTVKAAVDERFPDARIMPSGQIWWTVV